MFVSVCSHCVKGVCLSRDPTAYDEGSVIDGQGIDSPLIRDPAAEDSADRVRDPDH